jgi:outer membrane biosynthesis protein TonB
MAAIFLSYRREDAGGYAGRICDRLSARFGRQNVFIDVEHLRPGQDFAEALDETLNLCGVLLAIIGPRWVEMMKARAGREDYVVREIGTALRRGITVIPALVGGGELPAAENLPEQLEKLIRRQAARISDVSFDDDVNRLIRSIEERGLVRSDVVASPGTGRKRSMYVGLAAGVVLLLAAGGLGSWVLLQQDEAGAKSPTQEAVATGPSTPVPAVEMARQEQSRRPQNAAAPRQDVASRPQESQPREQPAGAPAQPTPQPADSTPQDAASRPQANPATEQTAAAPSPSQTSQATQALSTLQRGVRTGSETAQALSSLRQDVRGITPLQPFQVSQTLSGVWLAEMQAPQRRPYQIRLNLKVSQNRLTGTVKYPTGQTPIQDGQVSGERFSFYTRHLPPLADEPVTIRIEGLLSNDELQLTSTDDAVVSTGKASRAPQ